MQIRPLTPHLGVKIVGVALSDLDHELGAQVRSWFDERRVVVFRDQTLDREQHKALGRVLGDLHVHPSKRHLGARGDPEIFTVKADDDTTQVNGGRWHMDVSCEANPPAGSILRLIEGPPSGGDTVFADMHLAFETLSAPIRSLLLQLDAFHDGMRDLKWYGFEPQPGQTYPSHTHPVIVAHPRTGRPTLFVNEGFTERIDGLTEHESRALLDLLFDHVARTPQLQCRVSWEPDTVVMWDNRAVQHHAVWDYAPHHRRGERVSVVGDGEPIRWAG